MMMEGGKRVYIYKPGFQTFENCIEYSGYSPLGSKPVISFVENKMNIVAKSDITAGTYVYIKADFTKYKRLVFKTKNLNEKEVQIGYKDKRLSVNDDYTDMTAGIAISGTEERRFSFDISKADGEQYIFIGGKANFSVDIFDIHFL